MLIFHGTIVGLYSEYIQNENAIVSNGSKKMT